MLACSVPAAPILISAGAVVATPSYRHSAVVEGRPPAGGARTRPQSDAAGSHPPHGFGQAHTVTDGAEARPYPVRPGFPSLRSGPSQIGERHVQRLNERIDSRTVVLSRKRFPSGDLKQLLILDELDGRGNVSQRMVAQRLGVATGLVNRLIRELLDEGHLEFVDRNVRPYAYRLTPSGREYR